MYNNYVKNICIFGGTFDPPHIGHNEIVKEVINFLDVDLVVIVPCGQPVHKSSATEVFHRLEMAKLAFGGMEKVKISDYEAKKRRKSYSLYTVKYFKRKYRRAKLFFVIGSDSLEEFCSWYKPNELLKYCEIVVVPRANHDFKKAKQSFEKTYKKKPIILPNEPLNISATELRVMLEFELDTKEFLLEPVAKYVKDNELYSKHKDICEKAKKYLSKSRLVHTVYTTFEGLRLASRNNADYDKVFLACALHDIGKNVKEKDWVKYGFENTDNLPQQIVHAPLSAAIAEKEFGIVDESVLNAIRFHSTARPEMSLIEKIVYVSDIVEISRQGMDEFRRKCENDLDEGFLLCLKGSYNYALQAFGSENVSQITKKSINYYKRELREKNEKTKSH